jgi:hypothetical protein
MAARRYGPREQPRRPHGVLYEQLLLFPERAEFLDQERYRDYRTRLDHWRELSTEFRQAFEAVYERRSARVLLVHGSQGTGKTLFTRKLQDDFEKARKGTTQKDPDNLWHVLAGGTPIDQARIDRATVTTAVRRISPRFGWLVEERDFARSNEQAMRVFIIDDFHRDVFLRELADLGQGDFLRLKAEGKDGAVLDSVAQRLVEDCRGDFARSLFLLLSNDHDLLVRLRDQLDRSHAGLARLLSLPMPNPPLKEEIVRTNTNRLNQRSYWYCLDQGGPEEKRQAYRTLTGEGGFIDSFQAIDHALSAGASKRSGRPANKNLITLVTLGADPLTVEAFIGNAELDPSENSRHEHVSAWLFRETWAAALGDAADAAYSRKAGLVESEFALRWMVLGARATWCICAAPVGDELAMRLIDAIRLVPRIGDSKSAKTDAEELLLQIDKGLGNLANDGEIASFVGRFKETGQGRSVSYEPAIARRFGIDDFGRSLRVFPGVKPDVILSEYEPCAVTRASSEDAKAIEAAIRRGCHVIEVTAHMQADLRGLDAYLRDKVFGYASLLESV